jgi:hypothetical protein
MVAILRADAEQRYKIASGDFSIEDFVYEQAGKTPGKLA